MTESDALRAERDRARIVYRRVRSRGDRRAEHEAERSLRRATLRLMQAELREMGKDA